MYFKFKAHTMNRIFFKYDTLLRAAHQGYLAMRLNGIKHEEECTP